MNELKIGVLGSTRGTDLQAIIDEIEAGRLNAKISLVVSDKKDAFILERARRHGIKTFFVDYKKFQNREMAEREIIKKLKDEKTELVLLIGFMKILTPYFVSEFRGRIWNIHPSLLPKYAGGMNLDVHEQVIKNKDEETGCTLHEVTEKVDAGKIIMQEKIKVLSSDTPETLKEKVQKLEQKCILKAIKMVIDKKLAIGESDKNAQD
jgi:formyltetrahydrofolate-dependent phosphoribosylglycinamide formyltransferase